LADNDYGILREQIEGLLQEGQQFGRRAAEWEKVETYWHIGDALARFLGQHGGSTYGEQTLVQLGGDLQMSRAVLFDILRFRRQVAVLQVRESLGWSHYRALLRLPADQLTHYEKLADAEAWTVRQLKRAIEQTGASQLDDDLAPAPEPLRPRFGRPYTYRVLSDRFDPSAPNAIDFGFHQLWVPTALSGFEAAAPGDTISLESKGSTTIAGVHTDRPALWTYVARVLRVVDGDTLDVVVDLGLGHRAFPRLRLRGIDTAELYTEAGRQARTFVEDTLANCPVVVIATRRTDTYGRYLADVKYKTGASDPEQILQQGTYLNRQLLKQSLASRYLP
jgi:micrococcal nuclease